MNAKTQAQINRMKEQTIGVEVEMNNITRKAAAKLAAEFCGTNRSEYTAHRNGYETYSAWDAQGREWKFQRDCSILGSELICHYRKRSGINTKEHSHEHFSC